WRREELYDGPSVADAPDIILELALANGYSYTCLPSLAAPDARWLRTMTHSELGGGKVAGMGGSHRDQGVFLFSNGSLTGAVSGTRIEDAGATVLASCGVDLPRGIDGRPFGSLPSAHSQSPNEPLNAEEAP